MFTGAGYYKAALNYAEYRYFEPGYYDLKDDSHNNVMQLSIGWNYVGTGHGTHRYQEASYDPVGEGNGDYVQHTVGYDRFAYPTTWDGFTIRDGYVNPPG